MVVHSSNITPPYEALQEIALNNLVDLSVNELLNEIIIIGPCDPVTPYNNTRASDEDEDEMNDPPDTFDGDGESHWVSFNEEIDGIFDMFDNL